MLNCKAQARGKNLLDPFLGRTLGAMMGYAFAELRKDGLKMLLGLLVDHCPKDGLNKLTA